MRIKTTLSIAIALLAIGGFSGCGTRSDSSSEPAVSSKAEATPASSATNGRPKIVAFGDSLTAGLGLAPQEAYPAILQQRIDAAGLNFEVVNAGVSGDTSAGGLSRVDWALGPDVKVLIVAFGGNDGLRGLPISELTKNLKAMVERAKAKQVDVVIAGMEAPPNLGAAYANEFRHAFSDVAKDEQVALVPFLLEGVAGIPALNQADGIHPTAAGASIAADNIWRVLEPTLRRQ